MPWKLTHEDIERIAVGAGILGTGGGGNPHRGMIRAQMQLELGNEITIVRLDELPDDALIVPMGGMGAPTIGQEKIGRGDEGKTAVEAIRDGSLDLRKGRRCGAQHLPRNLMSGYLGRRGS